MTPLEWSQDTAIRCIKTFAQSLYGVLFVNATSYLATTWQADMAIAGMSAVACLLHNVSTFPTRKGAAGEA